MLTFGDMRFTTRTLTVGWDVKLGTHGNGYVEVRDGIQNWSQSLSRPIFSLMRKAI